MTDRLSTLYMGVLLGWVLFCGFGLVARPDQAAIAGLILGLGLTLGLRRNIAIGGAMAVLEPIGVVLPLLALRHMALAVCPDLAPWLGQWRAWELAALVLLYPVFLAASMGVWRAEPYRLGYHPVPVALMVLGLCLYALAMPNPFLALLAVAAQAQWVLRAGSSNWFDHILHVLVVPVALFTLLGRLW